VLRRVRRASGGDTVPSVGKRCDRGGPVDAHVVLLVVALLLLLAARVAPRSVVDAGLRGARARAAPGGARGVVAARRVVVLVADLVERLDAHVVLLVVALLLPLDALVAARLVVEVDF
jgi:hypothetical protein